MTDKTGSDRRIQRTRAALWQALFDMMQEVNWDDINVRAICDRADVARSSFYLHFRNKQELLDFGFENRAAEIQADIARIDVRSEDYATLVWLVHHVHAGRKFFQATEGSDAVILSRFQRFVARIWAEELEHRGVVPDEMAVHFAMGGVTATLQNWVQHGCVQPPDVLARQLSQLAASVMD